MKILRLDLRAFAQFSHRKIEFDPSKKIHVIYGRNEAGKTSFTRAFKALLFGIDKKSKDSFLHSEENLFIEGLLESSSGRIIQILRESKSSKKETQKLLQILPTLDKKSFSNLFCLNQETIKMGSKDLLDNLKHFDQSLFSSIQGSKIASKLIDSIESDFEAIYKARGSKPRLNQDIQQFLNLLEEKNSLILSQNLWGKLCKEERETEKILEKLNQEYNDLSKKQEDLEILIDAYSLLGEFGNLKKQLESFDESKVLKEEKLKLVEENNRQIDQISKKSTQLNIEVSKIKGNLDELIFDSRLTGLKKTVESINDGYPDFLMAKSYIEKSRIELNELKKEFKVKNHALQKKISSSISKNEWVNVKKTCEEICSELKSVNGLIHVDSEKLLKFTEEYKSLEVKRKKLTDLNEKREKLLKLLGQLDEYFDLEKNFKKSEREIKELQSWLNGGLIRFRFENFKEIKEGIRKTTQILFEYEKACYLRDRSALKHDKIQDRILETIDFSFSAYLNLKVERKKASKDLIDHPWNASNFKDKYRLFKKYQSLIDKEDIHEEVLIKNLDKIANLESLKKERQELEEEKVELDTKLQLITHNLSEFLKANTTNFTELSHEHCKELSASLGNLEKLCDLLLEKKNQSDKIQTFKQELCLFLEVNVRETSFESIKKRIQEEVNPESITLKEGVQQLKRLEFLQQSIPDLVYEIDLSKRKKEELYLNWKKIENLYQVKISFNELELSQLIKNLDSFFELSEVIQLKTELIKQKVEISDRFQRCLEKISGFTDIKPENISDFLKRIKEEEQIKEKRENLLFLLREKENEIHEIEKEKQRIALLQQKNMHHFQMKLAENIAEIVSYSLEYYSIRAQLENLKVSLSLKCRPRNLNYYLERRSSYKNRECIKENLNQISETRVKIVADRLALQKKLGEIQYQKKELNNFSKRYRIEEQLQGTLYEIGEGVQKYLVSKTAYALVKKLIWEYQEKNQHEILEKASAIFKILTGGKYVRIQLNVLGQKESFLVCVDSSGFQITVDVLSEGTRDQLFIALKFAMLQLYSDKNEVIPIILDDLFVNFDDQRSALALNFLNNFNYGSQIILLTHHLHILDMVRNSLDLDEFQIHFLSHEEILR